MLYCEAEPFQNSNDSEVHPVFRGKKHVHLFANTKKELLDYAVLTLGLKASWIQNSRGFIHFDVTGRYMQKVLNDSKVTKLSRKDFIVKAKEIIAASKNPVQFDPSQ